MRFGWWPHHHCGPGNYIKSYRSLHDHTDNICRDHDKAYRRYGNKAYIYYNKADDRFIRRMDRRKGVWPKIYAGYFKGKKRVAPVMDEPRKKRKLEVSFSSSKNDENSEMPRSRSRGRTPTRSKSPMPTPRKSRSPKKTYQSRGTSTDSIRNRSMSSGRASSSKATAVIAASSTDVVRARTTKKGRILDKGTPNLLAGNLVAKTDKKFNKMSYPGWVHENVTTGAAVTDAQAIIISHTDMAQRNVIQTVARALVKSLWRKCGVYVTSLEQPIPPAWAVAPFPTARLEIRDLVSNGATVAVWTYTATALSTFNDWCVSLSTSIETYLVSNLYGSWAPAIMTCSPKGNNGLTVEFDLSKAEVTVLTSNILKVKNISVDGTNDSILDVNASPFIGKGYIIGGTNIEFKGYPYVIGGDLNFSPDTDSGYTVKGTASVGGTKIDRPPLKATIGRCRSMGNIGMNVGEIKSHIAGYSHKGNLWTFLTKLGVRSSTNAAPINLIQTRSIGTTYMFYLYKQIFTDNGNLSVEAEHNMTTGVIVNLKPTIHSCKSVN
ncbi:coat protein [Lake Sarah-associated circular virus-44]|uniref:Coat protein n=1 Tax=Lake Sarah-associated circular virus-44 TaxID=1685773 RepID=A0A126GA90_9VIRU|nr:coat protein [Lake Sarah-associated circular virus-44]ALE29794.1 coat protein [Lake Sarah-associated circular virus-44]